MPYIIPDSTVALLLPVSTLSGSLAAATLLVSVVLYFVTPRRRLWLVTFILYTSLTVTIASIIATTGHSSSPLIGLWMGVVVFAGIFGWLGIGLIGLLLVAHSAHQFVTEASISSIVIAVIATLASLVVSFIIWHSKSEKDTKQDKAYRELATELSHEANKSEIVINAINDGVLAVDKEGVIQLINPAATQLLGWGQNDAIGLSYESVVKLKDKADKPIAPEDDPIAKVLGGNREVHSEDFSISTEAGKKMLLSVVVSPLGQPANGAIMVFRDMTKEKAEEREQAEFISTASHEMRTPVASIEGYLGLALNPATATIDEKARDYIQKAQASAQHLGRLFQDLLDVTKADDGRLNSSPVVVDTAAFVGDIAEGLRPKALEKNLRFVYQPHVDDAAAGDRQLMPVYYVHADKDHLREVTSNLIENAIKYTLTGDVVVNVVGDDSHVTISVKDSGIGIPAEDIPHLFQKFYRVDNSDTREIGGTGLGLYLCRRLAEVMGGRMTVESEYKKGSTFSLVLPRIDHTEAVQLKESTPAVVQPTQQSSPAQPQISSEAPEQAEVQAPVVAQNTQPQNITQTQSTPDSTPQQPVQAPALQNTAQPIPTAATRPGQDILPRRPVTPQAPNIPLSQLEQNKAQYTSRPVQIPNRGTSNISNQP